MENGIIVQNQKNLTLKSQNIYTIIEINSKKYALKTKNVLEIVKVVELDYFNQMLSCILGIIRYKKEPVGVLDLRAILKEKREVYGLTSKIIVLNTKNSKTAFIADRVIDIRDLDHEKIYNMPYGEENYFFEGVYTEGEENIYILYVEGIISYIEKNHDKFDSKDNIQYLIQDEQSKQILKKRKLELDKMNYPSLKNISLYDSGVSFNIDENKYYINMASVREFYKIKNSKFIKIPYTKDYILGLVNIKGEFITILDIKMLYGGQKTTLKEKSTVIILNSDEYKIGILADEITESLNINFDEISNTKIKYQNQDKMPEFVKDKEVYQIVDMEELLKDERLQIC